MFRAIRSLFSRLFNRKPTTPTRHEHPARVVLIGGGSHPDIRNIAAALAVKAEPVHVLPFRKIFDDTPEPQLPRLRIRGPRHRRPARSGAHSAPFLMVHTVAPCRVYHRCGDRTEAMKWLEGRPGVLERVNGFGQIIKRERL